MLLCVGFQPRCPVASQPGLETSLAGVGRQLHFPEGEAKFIEVKELLQTQRAVHSGRAGICSQIGLFESQVLPGI